MKRFTTINVILTALMLNSCSFWGQEKMNQENNEDSTVVVQEDVSKFPNYTGRGKRISSVPVNGKYVALTFDDGPHPTYTPKILDILKKHNAKATFFVLGSRVKSHPSIVARTVNEGSEVGVHTWNHPNLTKCSPSKVRKEIGDTLKVIQAASNYTPRTMRPPYGAVNANLVGMFAAEYNLSTIMWSIDTNDWRKPGIQKVINEAVNKAQPGSIILIHDIHGSSYEAVDGIVTGLIKRGYSLVTVSQLMAMQKKDATPDSAASQQRGSATAPSKSQAPASLQAEPKLINPFGAVSPSISAPTTIFS